MVLQCPRSPFDVEQEAPGHLQIVAGLYQLHMQVGGCKPLTAFEFLPSVGGFTPLEPGASVGGRKENRKASPVYTQRSDMLVKF